MKFPLLVNDLIQHSDQSGKVLTERIIWIDENNVVSFVINVYGDKSLPELKNLKQLRQEIAGGCVDKLDYDPLLNVVRDENLSEKQKMIRDKAWSIIASLVTPEREPFIYYREERWTLITQVAQQNQVTEKTVYKYLRKYWQRGKNRNALLPDYHKSGGRGKPRKSGEKKRGRPRKYASDPQIGVGVNIDEREQKIFRICINRYYHNRKQNSLETAYRLMIKEFYTEDFIYEDGIQKPILIPPGQRPSLAQFRYWYQQEFDIEKTLTARKGAKRYALENRAILGTSTMETIGPGSRYQIDATVADLYLVSRYNRNWVIGRPVIYVIIDVFSRMVAGVYVGLEGPSWLGAMMALVNAATDKVRFCQEYGINISSENWPCSGLPQVILADGGELKGKMVETLIANLNVRVENAAAYRADWKGIVERHFRTIHEYVKPFVPGYVDKDKGQRGVRDYRLDGKLNIQEFTEIVIRCILYHNNEHYLESYDRDEMMIADNVPVKPIDLWRWGISNRSGRLVSFPEDILKLNLMPAGRATVTGRGIRFKGMRYSCDQAIEEQWFDQARSHALEAADKYLDVSYDPRSMNFIYIRFEGGRGFEKCFLLPSEERYRDKSLDEIEYLREYERLTCQRSRGEELQKSVDLAAHIEHIVNGAEKAVNNSHNQKITKTRKVLNMRGRFAAERAELRREQAFELAKPETPGCVETANLPSPESNEPNIPDIHTSVAPQQSRPNYLHLLKQKRQELWSEKPE